MNLFVGNLHPDTTADSLRALFSEFGEILVAKVIFDNTTGTSRGFGFVEMADKGQSYDAIDNLDCSYFEGNIISVKEAKQNNTNSRGGGGGGNKFNRPQRNRTPRQGGYSSGGGSYNSGGGSYNSNSSYNRYNNNNNNDGQNFNKL